MVENGQVDLAARKRAATELIRSHERTLRRTARRYSICGDDAEDAYQRALEILLRKAPSTDPRELIRWMQTVTKHEALAVRRNRERILGFPANADRDEGDSDWVQLIPSTSDGPADLAERRERIARSREALQALKPQELRALTLLAEGYSYTEITELTGWTYTKVNRCLAEGRARFREVLSRIEEGRRCQELGPALSAYCDGEEAASDRKELREHLRTCAHCRGKLRAFRAAPRAAAALAPVLPVLRSLGERLHELVGAAQSRMPGRTGVAESAINQIAAAGGTRGGGMALAAKLMAACVGTAGGAAACVAAGVAPPVGLPVERATPVKLERQAGNAPDSPFKTPDEPAFVDPAPPVPTPEPSASNGKTASDPAGNTSSAAPAPAAEFSPEVAAPAPASPAGGSASGGGSSSGGSQSSGGSVGEFGP